MTEIPILFNGEMIRAIADRLKTQTRRPMKPQPEYMLDPIPCEWYTPTIIRGGEEMPGKDIYGTYNDDRGWKSPFGAPGDLLYVRENFWHENILVEPYYPGHYEDGEYIDDGYSVERVQPEWYEYTNTPGGMIADDLSANILDHIRYCATDPEPERPENVNQRWWEKRPSIHMPEWACRTRLLVKRVWVERVQSISEADAIAEGIGPPQDYPHVPTDLPGFETRCYRERAEQFADLWDSIYAAKYPWADNPWVWACEFEVKT